MIKVQGAVFDGALAELLANIGAIGAGGAVLVSGIVVFVYWFVLGRPIRASLEAGALAAVIAAPAVVAGIAYWNLLVENGG